MKKGIARIFATILIILIGDFGSEANEENAKTFLLPGDLKPSHYNVRLMTKIDQFRLEEESSFQFDGEIQIFMHATRNNVTEIVLNSERLTTIRGSALHISGSEPVYLGTGNYNSTTEKLTFPLPFSVRKGEDLRLDINVTVLHNDFVGFVYSFYYGKNGEKRWFLYTDLEPACARLVFPCFDEPKYKATFNVSVSVPTTLISDGYHVLSNAPVRELEKSGDNTITHFHQTRIPMSTYLFAVVVSDFVSTKPRFFNTSHPHHGLEVLKTWGKSEDLETYSGDYPQSVASALIKIYTKDFGIGYDFGKIDQVALHGYPMAMENWGLVYYQSSILSGDSEVTATTIAHELSHQWFGNFVTLHWWSDVWLNEGFATYFQYFGADKINDEGINGKFWNLPHQFVIDMVQFKGMFADVPERDSHSLTIEVYDPNEYSQYFDKFSYGKGASIVYMLRNVFGERAFEKVIRLYLRSFQVGVATPEGLLNCFDRYSNESESNLNGMSARKIFRNWHVKPYVPIVSVMKSKENPSNYILWQDVFRLSKYTEVEKAEWTIPISYSTSDNLNFNVTKAEFWLIPGKNLTITLPKPAKWIIVNNQESGYYRVNYNAENWETLFRVLNESDEIHEINRAQIIDDSFEIASSTAFDYLTYDSILDGILYLRRESSRFPWKSALRKLEFLKYQMSKMETVYPLFRMFLLDLVSNRVESSWSAQRECDSGEKREFENDIISWACEMGHSSCSLESKRSLQFLRKGNKVCADSLAVAYCSYIRSNSENLSWNELWNDYESTRDERLKKSLVRGLGCAKNELLLKRILEKSIEANRLISRSERADMISSVLGGNVENVKTLLTFVEENLRDVYIAFSRKYLRWDVLVDIAERLGTDEELSRIRKISLAFEELSESNPIKDKILEKVMSVAKRNNEWQKIRSKSVSDWLISRYSSEKA